MKKSEIWFLLIAIVFIVLQHIHYFSELYYDCDIPIYAYSSLNILNGEGWFHGIWHGKPPGINFIIISAFKLFGQSFKSIYLVALIFNLSSLVLIYLLAKLLLSKETKLYFLLPVFFILFFAAEPFRAYSANTEIFLLPFEIAGILFLGLNRYLLSGLFLGLGFLIRQTEIYAFVAGFSFIVAAGILDKTTLKAIIKNLLGFIVAFILPLLLISLWFFNKGAFDKFFKQVFLFNVQGLGEYLTVVRKKELLLTAKIFWVKFNFEIILFGLLSLIATICTIFKRSKARILITLWFLITSLGLLISAVYSHHFIQLMPAAATISLLGFSDIFENIKKLFTKKAYLRNIFISILITLLFASFIRLTVSLVARMRFTYSPYLVKDRLSAAAYIKEHTSAQDKIFVWDGADAAAIYFWSKRKPVSLDYVKYIFLPSELRQYLILAKVDYRLKQKKLLWELRNNMPKYIVVVSDYTVFIDNKGRFGIKMKDFNLERNAFPEFFKMLKENYQLEKETPDLQVQIYRYKNEKN